MIAVDLPWYLPLLLFAIGVTVVVVLAWRNERILQRMDAKLDDIDHAVNDQPIGTMPMVEKVALIEDDVAEITLRASADISPNPPTPPKE